MNERFHFIGIGGIGMSAIARILLARGQTITGSDQADSQLLEDLRRDGAVIAVGHDAANVNGAGEVVVSSAIDAGNPEYREACDRGIPIVRRGAMLARLMQGRRGIAVCGTHGKTTTTAMTAAILREAGIDAGLVLGGIDVSTGSNAHDGTDSWFLTEADESDGSFRLLDPVIAVVTNIENDHLSSDAEMPALVASFESFLHELPENGTAILGIDNPQCRELAGIQRAARTLTFGRNSGADLQAQNVRLLQKGSEFDVIAGGSCIGALQLPVPGTMNVENALAATAVGRVLEIPFATIAAALRGFRGVHRRFDVLAKTERMTIVDDYAHHPTEIRETLLAARRYHAGPVIAVFQPHRYTRTAQLAPDFADALSQADGVYLAPVYAANELPIPGVSAELIGSRLRDLGVPVTYVKNVDELRALLPEAAPPNALVVLLGAGNITKVAADLANDVASR